MLTKLGMFNSDIPTSNILLDYRSKFGYRRRTGDEGENIAAETSEIFLRFQQVTNFLEDNAPQPLTL
jgi:hypothetical protein